ncbi:hypothetical protein AGMMS50256_31250 [Betaproteobacteria bacterium]|nr:hypothetical protein AGMMS50256_31250 [Betaproteobacteria bacterium]
MEINDAITHGELQDECKGWYELHEPRMPESYDYSQADSTRNQGNSCSASSRFMSPLFENDKGWIAYYKNRRFKARVTCNKRAIKGLDKKMNKSEISI